MKVKNLGAVVKIYGSGMVESDKGFKYPYSKANVGDMMLDVDGSRIIVTKEVYKTDYLPFLDVSKAPKMSAKELKAQAEADAKAQAEADAKAQAEADAKAQAEADAKNGGKQ